MSEPTEILVVVLKNRKTGKVVRLLPATFVAQIHRYNEDWEYTIDKQKLEMFKTLEKPLK